MRRGIELLNCVRLLLSFRPRAVVALERNEDDEREQDRERRADDAEDGTGPVDVRIEATGGRAPANQVHARDRDADTPKEHERGDRQSHAAVLTLRPLLRAAATMSSTLANEVRDSPFSDLRQRSAFVMTELSPAAVSSATWSRNLWKSSEPERSAIALGMAGKA